MNSVKTGLIDNRIQNNNLLGENLIYKYPFQNPIFNESKELLDWTFSKIILITAFDLLRNDGLVSFLQRSGSTLKEYIRDFGFNKDVKIMVDTGIFEVEAKKARLDFIHSLPPELDLHINDIFTAYELIDPDYLIAPDEMILLEDDEKIVESKIETIISNLDLTLDRFPYDSSFSLRDDKEIEIMADALSIRESILKIKSRYDLVYIALSDPYLEAIGDLRIFEGIGKEIIYFGSPNFKVGLSLKYPFINFATEEFNEISRGYKFKANLGERYRLKGSIFENYALDLRDTYDKPLDISFVKYWYKIFEKSKSKYFYE